MDEVWKPVPGYTGYEVSNLGRVRSYKVKGGHGKLSHVSHILKQSTNQDGYKILCLGQGNIKRVHRLVLLAFVGPCPNGMEVCHNNGNPSDNRLDNLRYDTRIENSQDTIRLRGKFRKNGIVDNMIAQKVMDEIQLGNKTLTEIAKEFNLPLSAISNISIGNVYKPFKLNGLSMSEIKIRVANEIKKAYAKGNITQAKLARDFKLSPSTVNKILNGTRRTKGLNQ